MTQYYSSKISINITIKPFLRLEIWGVLQSNFQSFYTFIPDAIIYGTLELCYFIEKIRFFRKIIKELHYKNCLTFSFAVHLMSQHEAIYVIFDLTTKKIGFLLSLCFQYLIHFPIESAYVFETTLYLCNFLFLTSIRISVRIYYLIFSQAFQFYKRYVGILTQSLMDLFRIIGI